MLVEYAEEKREYLNYMYLEIRTRDRINNRRFLAEERSNYLNFCIELNNDSDRIWSLITGNARTSVRKAEKSGLTVREGNSEEDIKNFYELNLITRKKNGIPSFSIEFFQNIIKELKVKLLFAELGNKTIASILISSFKDYVYYMYSVSNAQYKHLYPTDLSLWYAIKWASLNGFKYFDLGRTDRADKGLIFFKEKWGSQSEVLRYYYLPRSSFVSSRSGFKFSMVNTLYKRLPVAVAKIFGPPIVKRLG